MALLMGFWEAYVVDLIVTSDFKLVLATLFSTGWRIATSFHIPGTNLNIPEFALACLMVAFAIKVVPPMIGGDSPLHPSDSSDEEL